MKENNSFNEIKRFLKDNYIKSRIELYKNHRSIYLKFSKLTEEEKGKLLPSKNSDYSSIISKSDFKKFIQSNNITSRTDFGNRFRKLYDKFTNILTELDKEELLPSKIKDYSPIKTIEDLSNFIKKNNISSRNELKKYSGALRFFRSLSKEQQDSIICFRGINLSKLKTEEDIKNFIKDNHIVSRSEFKKKFSGVFKIFKNLTKDIQDKLLPTKKENHSYLNTYEDFEKYFKEHNIKNRWELKKQIYNRFTKLLSKEDQEKLLSHIITNNTINFNSIEDFNKFSKEIMINSDFRDEYSGIYKKFKLLTDIATDNDKMQFKQEMEKRNHSFGEKYLTLLFIENGINFITEKIYSDLKDNFYLRYDFYLPRYNTLVEYHGEQHFIVNKNNNLFYNKNIQLHDEMKYNYALNNKINIIFFTLCNSAYNKFGYFTDVITDPNILINKIKEIGLTNRSLNNN